MGSLCINTEMLAAAYDYLQTTPPYCDWNLPDSDDIVFKVYKHRARCADWGKVKGKHVVRVSSFHIKRTNSLLETMAHELIHIHEDHNKCAGRGEHSAAFRAWAKEVCAIHGWDEALF